MDELHPLTDAARSGPSLKRALMIPLAIAVLLLAAFVGMAITTSPTKSTTLSQRSTLAGLPTVPITSYMNALAKDNEPLPPNDVIHALLVPEGSRLLHAVTIGAGITQYDTKEILYIPYSYYKVSQFFQDLLSDYHWAKLQNQISNATGELQLLAQRPSSDGYYWELHVTVVSATSSASPVPLARLPSYAQQAIQRGEHVSEVGLHLLEVTVES